MNEYWISWYSVFEYTGSFELHSPWWVSGWSYDADENEESIIVAAVRADSEEEAWEVVKQAYDTYPKKGFRERFIETFEEGETKPWEREGGRFQLADWMEW